METSALRENVKSPSIIFIRGFEIRFVAADCCLSEPVQIGEQHNQGQKTDSKKCGFRVFSQVE